MIEPVTARLRVRVQPNASRTEVAGWYGGALRVRTTALPVRGKANQAVAEMLAQGLGIPKTDVRVIRGHGARDKVMEIVGIDEPEALRRLNGLVTSGPRAATTR